MAGPIICRLPLLKASRIRLQLRDKQCHALHSSHRSAAKPPTPRTLDLAAEGPRDAKRF